MLKTDKPAYKAILILNLLLLVAGLVLCVFGIASPDANLYSKITRYTAIVVLIFGDFYILRGHGKDSAKYYKLFGAFYALYIITAIVSISTNATKPMIVAYENASLVIVLVLVLSENIGKLKSFILCGLLVLINIAVLVTNLITGKYIGIVLSMMFIDIVLACLYGIMTYAKYLDKAERGTK